MNWTDEQKPLVESYARGYAWISMYKDEEGKIEDFNKVNERMMSLETEMKEKGVTSEQIDTIIAGVNKILAKTTGEMSSRELEFVCKVIFGKETKLTPSNMRPTDQIFVNGRLMTYAYYTNHKAEVDALPPPEYKEDTVDKNKPK